MLFSEVIGQEDVKQRLLQMAAEEKVPHAIMLCGASGYGSLALALAFASYLLGEREESTNANVKARASESKELAFCREQPRQGNAKAMLAKFQHPDLHFIFPVIRPAGTSSDRKITSDDFIRQWQQLLTETPYFTFEEWLSRMGAANQQAQIPAAEGDVINHKLSLKASQHGYKTCIIWLPERMHATFANKILKLLEEPPQQTVFIMACEEPRMLLDTIRSRVQRIDVHRIADEDIHNALLTRRGLDDSVAQRVTRMAAGNWLRAVEQLDTSNEKHQFLDMFKMLMRMAYQRDTRRMKKWAETIADFGREKQRRLLTYISSQVRENFMYNFAREELVYLTEEEEEFSRNFARFINENNVIDMQNLIDRTTRAIGQNANAKMQFFDFALQITVMINRR